MPAAVIASFSLITLALVFYSLGVWSERLARDLKRWHVTTFWIGFPSTSAGTLAMHRLAKGPFDLREPHTLTGQVALWLMLAHAAWATGSLATARRRPAGVSTATVSSSGASGWFPISGACIWGCGGGELVEQRPHPVAQVAALVDREPQQDETRHDRGSQASQDPPAVR